MDIAPYIDHTLLRPDATEADVAKLCDEAKRYGFASACVASCWAALASERLRGSGVRTCCVVGFPFGSQIIRTKAFEAERAVEAGAEEIDAVINVGFMKSGRIDYVKSEIADIVASSKGAQVKIIIETCYLTDEEKVLAAKVVSDAGAAYVKTSTGYGTKGATLEDVKLIKKEVPGIKIKASGGIRTYKDARAFVEAGASRIGASSGPNIVEGSRSSLADDI